jgi:hypothetical protein
MFHTSIGFEHLSFSDYDDVDPEKAVMPPSIWSEATSGKKSLMFTAPSLTVSGLMGSRVWGFIQCFLFWLRNWKTHVKVAF